MDVEVITPTHTQTPSERTCPALPFTRGAGPGQGGAGEPALRTRDLILLFFCHEVAMAEEVMPFIPPTPCLTRRAAPGVIRVGEQTPLLTCCSILKGGALHLSTEELALVAKA